MQNRVFLIVFAMVLAVSAHGQTAVRWAREIDKSSAHLKAGEFDRSLRISERLLREMIDQLGSGEAATRSFGTVLTHKALALAGLGRKEEALWHWHTVLTLYPPFEKSNLSSFGDAGAFLAANRNPRIPEALPSGLEPPVVVRRVAPDFPPGAHHFGVEGVLIVNVIVRTDGTATAPYIRKTLPAPTLSYVALEAIRKWKFRPATKGGVPIEAPFDLALSYKQ